MFFGSDNWAGVADGLLADFGDALKGAMPGYGNDPFSAQLKDTLSKLFETEVLIFPVVTGTAANALSLACFMKPGGVFLAHDHAHVVADECGAVELFSGGRLRGIGGAMGKIDPTLLAETLASMDPPFVHYGRPVALTLTNATEAGTVYTPAEVKQLSDIAKKHGLGVHMDGARFANALAFTGATPAEMTWKAGVDVLSLGATKDGAFAAEVIVLFKHDLAEDLSYHRKRTGHLLSKSRVLSAQLNAFFKDDRWMAGARHANAQAAKLAAGLKAAGIDLPVPVQANELFPIFSKALIAKLQKAGATFYEWPSDAMGIGKAPESHAMVRLVTSFATHTDEVEQFLALVRQA